MRQSLSPGHGKEDYDAGKAYKLDIISPVSMNGNLTEETGKYAGKKAREVDEEIIRDLDDEGMLAKKEGYDAFLIVSAGDQWVVLFNT